ncbi:MAG TPA: ubiquinol-cytochrome c reductase iron-sulfur subunit [Kofleriaceae bacterium]|nr:ubiquinol-cytochrome c reductase iron-sulfur subunit [Kofleriaceae bacterium]
MSEDDPDRRKFLKLATCGLGGIVGIAATAPAVSLVLAPTSRQTVTTPTDPIDLGDATIAKGWSDWRKVDVIAPEVRDGWTTARNIVLGAAYIRATSTPDQFEALSGVCPHLGCAVGWEGKSFLCPCHDSKFAADGAKQTGPSLRGLDPLPIKVENGRLRLTWVRYKLDTASREPA